MDYGSVHFLIMSTEHDFTIGSVQYQFLENDLRNVNRSTTPWLVLAGHRPMYAYTENDTNRYAGVQPVAKLLRDNLEELLQVRPFRVWCVVGSSPTRGSSFFLGKLTALGMLCCFALLFVRPCFLLSSFLLISH